MSSPAAKRDKRPREEKEPVEAKENDEMMIVEPSIRRATTDKRMTNRQKCLTLCSRGVTSRDRHLMVDLRNLMPHARDHPKIGSLDELGDQLVELCDLHRCNSTMFLEAHRKDISYMWLAQAPNGPSVKLQLTNVHTADEVRMAGNCLKYSRPLLHFDKEFETLPHLRVVKSLFQMTFNTPRYHPRSKPFVDHIVCFFYLDHHVWFRHYQIVPNEPFSLLEVGPRFSLEPIAIFNGCCKGKVIWKSAIARPPTEQRRDRKLRQLEKIEINEKIKQMSERHKQINPAPKADPLDAIFKDD